MIRKRYTFFKILAIVILLISLIIIVIKKHNIIKTKIIAKRLYYNIQDVYIEEEKISNYYIDNNTIEIPLYINFDKESKYQIKYSINNTNYDLEIESQNESYYPIEIQLTNEGNNEINLQVLKNNNEVFNWKKNIIFVKSIEKQFLSEKNKNGFCVHLFLEDYNADKEIELLKALGINNIRIEIRWEKISSSSLNKFYYTTYDEWMNKIKQNNINTLVILNAPNSYFKEKERINSQEDLDRFLLYASKVDEGYPEICSYEILNEQNLVYGDEEGAYWYSQIVKQISERLKNKKIIAGATFLNKSVEFFNNISKNGAYQYADNYSFHLYDFGKSNIKFNKTDTYAKLHTDLINNIGGFLPLDITETGVSTYTKDEMDEKQQGERLCQLETIHKKYNINSSYIYNFRDNNENKDDLGGNFGVIKKDYSPKDSYFILKKYFENTNGAEYIGQIKVADGVEAYVYDKDGKPKIILWAEENDVTIKYSGFVAKDIYGNIINNENDILTIGVSPIYLDNISTNCFYRAISNSIISGYSEFYNKFKNEISKDEELINKITQLNNYAKTLESIDNLSETIASSKMKEHFELGNHIMNSYMNGLLDVEYVKISSMLDFLNNIGNSYEDLVTVSAKTRIIDLSYIKNEVNNAIEIISNNPKIEMIYPNKICKVSQELLDEGNYILNLEEENDIKTGLIDSKLLHSYFLANWSRTFAKLYIRDILSNETKDIVSKNLEIKNNNLNTYRNIKIMSKYSELMDSINSLINNDSNTINQENIISIYKKQIEIIDSIVEEYNLGNISLNDSEYIDLIQELLELTENYKELFSNYVNDNNEIDFTEVKKKINEVIDNYNSYTFIDIKNEGILINKCKELYENSIKTENISINYLNRLRIINTCDIIQKMLDYDIEQYNNNNNISKIFNTENYIIKNINKNTTQSKLINILQIDSKYKVYRNNNELQSSAYIATGDNLKLNKDLYTLIVSGDINQDSYVNIIDLAKYRKYLLTMNNLSEIQKFGADTNYDKQLNYSDLDELRKIIVND